MENFFIIVGFLLAAYSVVANDVIQALGTFLSSNRDKKWWKLWLYISTILLFTMLYSWVKYSGDVSFERLDSFSALPSPFHWWYILPPLVLLVITRMGIPVSTTFLILTIFGIADFPESNTQELFFSLFDLKTNMGKMLVKSLSGYLFAISFAFIVYIVITKSVEKKFIDSENQNNNQRWILAQWFSTGFLWFVWLTQDLANIFIYLPRPLSLTGFILSVGFIIALLAYIFKNNGGEIQKIVISKTNTADIRSATIIDLIYGIILLGFKEYSTIPMSTTWVFVGLLAGREIAISLMTSRENKGAMFKVLAKDLGKVFMGLVVSIILVLLIHALQ